MQKNKNIISELKYSCFFTFFALLFSLATITLLNKKQLTLIF